MIKTLGIIASLFIVAICRGFVLSIMWKWFVMPIVFGVTALTIPQALGLSILIGIFTLNSNSSNKDIDEKSFSKAVIKGITFNSIALGLGWIVTLFM